MRIVLFFTAFSIVQAFAADSYAQNTRLSLKLNNVTIEKVLDEIENQSDFFFMYNQKLVDVDKKVDVDVTKERIKDILTEIFDNTETTFSVVDKQILLMPKDMALKMGAGIAAQQKLITIQGYVLDKDGEPLPGATVAEAGTENVTATDGNGMFLINVEKKDEVSLKISFIGMETMEVVWKGEDVLNVVMQGSDKLLDEVYVTGYQTISQERATGAFANVKQAELETYYSPNTTALLEGKVAGLSTYGDKITIRGVSTFTKNSQPLIVVDGLPLEGQTLDDINPNDIESITVLKDAAAASIYGARAANGVIVVSTKSASKNKTEVDFSMNLTMTPKDNKDYLNLVGISDYIDYEKSFLSETPSYIADPVAYFDQKDQNNERYSPVYYLYSELARGNMTEAEVNAAIAKLKNRGEYRDQYNDNTLRDQLMQQYNLSFRSGNEKSNLVMSLNILTNRAEQIKTGDEKYTFYFKNNLKLYDWFRIGYGVNAVISKDYSPEADIEGAQPYDQLVDANGNRVYRDVINQAWADSMRTPDRLAMGLYDMKYNALDEYEKNSKNGFGTNTRMFLDANFKLADWLNYDLMFQYTYINNTSKTVRDEESYGMRYELNKYAVFTPAPAWWLEDSYEFNLPQGGRLDNSYNKMNNYTLRNQLNFNKLFNENHAVTGLVGFELRENKYESSGANLYGYDDQTLIGQTAIDYHRRWITGSLFPIAVPFISPYSYHHENLDRYVSFYANGGYTYKNKYSATASFRVDQTNLFGTDPKYRYRPLWSVGGSWVMTEEDFMSGSDFVSYMKLRASYGVGGNVDHSTSPYLMANMSTSNYTGNPITTIFTPPNPFLRWEKTTTSNIGIDFALMKNRLSGSIDGYVKNSEDLLANKKFDPSLGFTDGVVNNGAMTNKGVELRLGYTWVNTSNWHVSTVLTAAYNKNEVTKVDYDPDVANDLLYNLGYYLQDAPLSAIYAYQYEGLDENGDPLVHDIIKDKNGNDKDTIISGDYVQNYEALLMMGQTEPKWSGSFQPVIRYKGFELSALLSFYTGHVMRDNVTPLYRELKGYNVHGDMVNAWTTTNKDTDIPRMASQDLSDAYRNSNWKYADSHILDASTLNLRNIVLSYTLRRDWSKAIKASAVRLNFQVNNVWHAGTLTSNYSRKVNLPYYVVGVNVNF